MNLYPDNDSAPKGCLSGLIFSIGCWIILIGIILLMKGCWSNAGGTL